MKKMKKIGAAILAACMVVSMTACGNKNNAADDANAVEDTEAGTESGSLILPQLCSRI